MVNVNDADVPSPDGTLLHWSVWRIKPKTRALEEGAVPPGARQGATDVEAAGYFGPCPPGEGHRYIFTVSALSKKLKLADGASADEFRAAMEQAQDRDQILAGSFVSGCYPTGCQ